MQAWVLQAGSSGPLKLLPLLLWPKSSMSKRAGTAVICLRTFLSKTLFSFGFLAASVVVIVSPYCSPGCLAPLWTLGLESSLSVLQLPWHLLMEHQEQVRLIQGNVEV